MTTQVNAFGQPIGFPVPDWAARPRPPRTPIAGRLCRIEPLELSRHAADLFAAFAKSDARLWTYMGYGPFATLEAYQDFLTLWKNADAELPILKQARAEYAKL